MAVIAYTHQGLVLLLQELGIELHKPALNLLAWLMVALLEKTAAHLVRLAEKLPDDASTELARRQRVRRFLSNRCLSPRLFVGPMVTLLRPILMSMTPVVLVLDRTEWRRRGMVINVLDVALYYEGRAIPLYWTVVNRPGNSGLAEGRTVLPPVIEALRAATWLQGRPLHVVADREFASPRLAEWLWETFRVESTLRLKRSEYLVREAATQKVSVVLAQLRPGQRRFLRGYTITRTSTFVLNVALVWEQGYEEAWVLMTTQTNFPRTVHTYGHRFGIEPMHKDWKSNAFDLEGTRVTQAKRIATLLIPIALCYVLCVLEGQRKETAGETIHAHTEKRTVGLFLVGLAAFTRILRTLSLVPLQQFFERLFTRWSWPQQLAKILQT